MKLIKLQLLISKLQDKNYYISEDILYINHYYDGAKASKNVNCVNDYVCTLNVHPYPTKLDLLLMAHIAKDKEENSFSKKTRLLLDSEIFKEYNFFKTDLNHEIVLKKFNSTFQALKKVFKELLANEMIEVKEDSEVENTKLWMFFDNLLNLADSPVLFFGFKKIILSKVLDLKSISDLFSLGVSSTFPSTFYGTVNSKRMNRLLSETELRKKYFVINKNTNLFEFELERNKKELN